MRAVRPGTASTTAGVVSSRRALSVRTGSPRRRASSGEPGGSTTTLPCRRSSVGPAPAPPAARPAGVPGREQAARATMARASAVRAGLAGLALCCGLVSSIRGPSPWKPRRKGARSL
jgi:hypothetical protein